jgi:hypothetical protein
VLREEAFERDAISSHQERVGPRVLLEEQGHPRQRVAPSAKILRMGASVVRVLHVTHDAE